MFTRSFCALLATAALLAPARAAGPDLGENAALKYWRAFELLPKFTPDEEKTLESTDAAARLVVLKKHFAAKSYCLVQLHRGVKLARCEWGCDWEDGEAVLMPHVQKCRQLARVACLRAEYFLETSKPDAAIDDLLAAWALARHLGQENTLISILVQIAVEATAMETACRYLPTLDAAGRKRLTDGLARRPNGGSVRDALLMEKKVFLPWIQAEALGDWRQSSSEDMKRIMKSIDPAVNVRAAITEMGTHYDRMAELSAKPRAEAKAGFAELMKTAKANPFSAAMLPAFDKVLDAEARSQARWALFDAALKIAADGQDAVAQTQDPFGDGPFKYRKTDGGFELESKLIYKDAPVTLTVGPKMK